MEQVGSSFSFSLVLPLQSEMEVTLFYRGSLYILSQLHIRKVQNVKFPQWLRANKKQTTDVISACSAGFLFFLCLLHFRTVIVPAPRPRLPPCLVVNSSLGSWFSASCPHAFVVFFHLHCESDLKGSEAASNGNTHPPPFDLNIMVLPSLLRPSSPSPRHRPASPIIKAMCNGWPLIIQFNLSPDPAHQQVHSF